MRGLAVEYAKALGKANGGVRSSRALPPAAQELLCLLFALSKVTFARPIGSRVFVDERVASCLAIEGGSIEAIRNIIYPTCISLDGQRIRLSPDVLDAT